MRKLGIMLGLAVTLALPAPAVADRDEDWCDGDGSCSSEREFNFHDSPVQIGDVTLCAPMATCEFHGEPDQEGEPT